MSIATLKEFTRWLGGWLLFGFAVLFVIQVSTFGRDDSDYQDWFTPRSGVNIVNDALTGCQYLTPAEGGIIARVDASGKHICNSRK